jgi:colanic acid biosynthesis glycosyl transferase WcaI
MLRASFDLFSARRRRASADAVRLKRGDAYSQVGGTQPAHRTDIGRSPQKILFVNRFFYPDHSATSQILSELAFDLARDGANVAVITSRLLYENAAAVLSHREIVRDVTVVRAWSTRMGRSSLRGRALDYLSFYLTASWAVWRRADRSTVIVVKTDPPLLAVAIAPIAWMRGARLINWLQDLFPEVALSLGFRWLKGPVIQGLRFARNATLRAAYANVVLGHRMEGVVRAQGVRSESVRIIPNWADGQQIVPIPRGLNELRKEWGLSDRFVVGYSGNLGRAHEFGAILQAAERLRDRSDIAFLFIGAGAQRKLVEAESSARGLANVYFRPYQPREWLGKSLCVADVHLVSLNPTLEGLVVPSKFYGVAAAGRPTLFVGDVDGEIARTLREADCGFATPSADGAALAEQILKLADEPVLYARLAGNARAHFEHRFDRAVAVRAWREILGLPNGSPALETPDASHIEA